MRPPSKRPVTGRPLNQGYPVGHPSHYLPTTAESTFIESDPASRISGAALFAALSPEPWVHRFGHAKDLYLDLVMKIHPLLYADRFGRVERPIASTY